MCNVGDTRAMCLLTLGQFHPQEDRTLMAECIATELLYEPTADVRVFGYDRKTTEQILDHADLIVDRAYDLVGRPTPACQEQEIE